MQNETGQTLKRCNSLKTEICLLRESVHVVDQSKTSENSSESFIFPTFPRFVKLRNGKWEKIIDLLTTKLKLAA